MVNKLPVYLISGHSCIGAEIGDTGMATFSDTSFPFAFTIPRGTFILSFSDPGNTTCLTKGSESFLQSQVALIRQLFYLHGPDEFLDHTAESIFSRTSRATGGRPGHPVAFPNPLYTFEPDTEGLPRAANIYGVFDISDYRTIRVMSNLDSIISQVDPSIPLSDVNKVDWTLEDIIQRVYKVTGNTNAIFLNMGCLTSCNKASKSIDKAAYMMQHANAMYKNIIPVMGQRNIQRGAHWLFRNQTHKVREQFSAIDLKEFKRMLDSGLYDPESFKEYIGEFHQDDRNAAREMINKFLEKS